MCGASRGPFIKISNVVYKLVDSIFNLLSFRNVLKNTKLTSNHV